MRRPALLAALAAALALPLAPPARAAGRPVVVELFTSQSCSSCPPAEALLGDLAREGGDVLPLAFHVTYWNHLDWRDTYALPTATDRQAAYAARLGGGSYTPEAVIDGRVGLVGSDTAAVRAAIARARDAGAAAVPVTLTRSGGSVTVRLGASGNAGTAGGEGGSVTLVGFDPNRTTRVARGENAGRTIAQVNVVRGFREIGRWTGGAAVLEAPMPAGEDAAVIVQAADGRILGAARLGAGSGT